MAGRTIIQRALCPWCHNEMDIIRSGKTGYHYANCKSCNAHFRNIPVSIIDPAISRNNNSSLGISESLGLKKPSLYESIFGRKNSEDEDDV